MVEETTALLLTEHTLDLLRPPNAPITWIEIPGRLAIMTRPRADDWLEVDVAEWKTSGVDLVVSLLEREEVSELGLQEEADLCWASGIEFISFPIPDRAYRKSSKR